MKKSSGIIASLLVLILLFSSCGGAPSEFNYDTTLTVVSREDGSGTRGAFIELFGIEEKGAEGLRIDHTTEEAIIANKTSIMLGNVASNPYAIGYVSIGSLSSVVKSLDIDGYSPTSENIASGKYTISRSFNIAIGDESNPLVADFKMFILSKEGQEVVSQGYVPIDSNAPVFASQKPEGKIVVAGSSSVTPIMEKLKEAYSKLNTKGAIEIQQNDSSTGLQSAMEGTCDIAMASRDLTEKELAVLTTTPIALDGIAIIVNNMNPIDNMTKETVRDIFIGQVTMWDQIKEGSSGN